MQGEAQDPSTCLTRPTPVVLVPPLPVLLDHSLPAAALLGTTALTCQIRLHAICSYFLLSWKQANERKTDLREMPLSSTKHLLTRINSCRWFGCGTLGRKLTASPCWALSSQLLFPLELILYLHCKFSKGTQKTPQKGAALPLLLLKLLLYLIWRCRGSEKHDTST